MEEKAGVGREKENNGKGSYGKPILKRYRPSPNVIEFYQLSSGTRNIANCLSGECHGKRGRGGGRGRSLFAPPPWG